MRTDRTRPSSRSSRGIARSLTTGVVAGQGVVRRGVTSVDGSASGTETHCVRSDVSASGSPPASATGRPKRAVLPNPGRQLLLRRPDCDQTCVGSRDRAAASSYAARVAKARTPPRPIAPGDIITGWSVDLGEWTAAQITYFHEEWDYVGVLELRWSGPQPATIADVENATPLRQTSGQWKGALAHTNEPWLLPRSAHVIGSRPLLVDRPSNSFGGSWDLGAALAYQRLHEAGVSDEAALPWVASLTGEDLVGPLAGWSSEGVRKVYVTDVAEFDCAWLVETFPRTQSLFVAGTLRTLQHAEHLNELHDLREVFLTDVFGMGADDVLRPTAVPLLEVLALSGIPKDYATATRALWRKEVRHGTALEVLGARTPEWVEENKTNPLRDWDTHEHITSRQYERTLKEYRRARTSIMQAFGDLSSGELPDAMKRIGVDFAQAINTLAARTHFVETEERDDLLAALVAALHEAGGEEAANGPACDALLHAVNSHRDW